MEINKGKSTTTTHTEESFQAKKKEENFFEMAAKLLHSLADDSADLQKQIGCMNGIFQIFDRHHVLTGRRKSLTLGKYI